MNNLEIKEFRKKYKLTQEGLAEITCVGVGAVRSWEQGSRNMSKAATMLLDKHIRENIVNDSGGEYTTAPNGKFDKKRTDNELVPFYNIDFAAGNTLTLLDNNKTIPDYYMDVPEFSGCTAFRAYSDSMERLIKSGSILFGTKVEEWRVHIEYGQIYGIICEDGRRYLKYIKKFKENEEKYFLLFSENDFYDSFKMPLKSIRNVWLIHGWINRRT